MRIANIKTPDYVLLESVMAGAEFDTRRYLKNMHENFVVPYNAYLNKLSRRLDEAELTADQVTQLFGTVAQTVQGAGGNETALGRLLPDAIKKKFADSLPAPDAGEVAGFEEKAQQAAAQVQDPQAKKGIMDWIKTGLANPVTQKMILAAVSGVAGVAAGALTGGMGGKLGAAGAGAIVGGLMGIVNAKMQGQDWKSAGMAGLKGAALGGAAGAIGSMAAGVAGAGINAMTGGTPSQIGPNDTVPGMKNGDESPMTGADLKKAMDQIAPVAGGDADPNAYYNSLSPEQQRAVDDAVVDQARGNNSGFKLPVDSQVANNEVQSKAADEWRNASAAEKKEIENVTGMTADQLKNFNTGSGAGSSDFAAQDPRRTDAPIGAGAGRGSVNPDNVVPGEPSKTTASSSTTTAPAEPYASAGKVRANLDQWRADNQAAVTPSTPSDGSYSQAAPIGANGQPMRQVPMDSDVGAQAATAAAGQITAAFTDGNNGTLTDVDGDTVPMTAYPPDGMQPRMPFGSEKVQFNYKGNPVTAYIFNRKAYIPNFDPSTGVQESRTNKKRALKEYVDREMTIRMWALNEQAGKRRGGVQLTEAGIGDFIKSAGNWLKTKAQNATQNVTADKLQQAWQKAGSPTDSEKVAELMKNAGVPETIIADTYKTMGVPYGSAGEKDADGRTEPTLDGDKDSWSEPEVKTPDAAKTSFGPGTDMPTKPFQVPGAGTNPTPPKAPTAPAPDAATAPAPNAAPAPADAAKPADAAAAPTAQAAPAAGSAFANPDQLYASFNKYMRDGGKLPIQFKGVLKDILLTAMGTVENKQRKLLNIIKESKRIERQLKEIKKKKHL